MKVKLLATVLASALLAATPSLALAQQARPATAAAQPSAAARTVLDASSRILGTLATRRSEFRANPATLRGYIDGEMSRSFDRDYAARLVLGVHGRGAPAADVADFAAAMADSLTARYGTSLLDFNTRLTVKVKSESPLPGGRGVRVTTQMLRAGKDPIPVDYLLRNVGGKWKVFDVMIEGISYVQAFKNQFDAPLNQKSIKQVAADLRAGKLQANGTAKK